MSAELTIPNILQIAQVCEYLASTGRASNNVLKGGFIYEQLPVLIYNERMAVQNRYNLNPSDPTLRGTANYLFSILNYQPQAQQIIGNLTQSPPVITGPGNQSVNVGNSATFTISVVSSLPYTVQWFLNGVAIPGATGLTYTKTNAQLIDSGDVLTASVTNAAGITTSNPGILTVTTAVVGYYFQGSADYSMQLLSGTDNVPYLGTFAITPGQPLLVTFPDLVSTEYIVIKYPNTETTKTTYLNPPPSGPDAGNIPSIALEGNSFGGWKYIYSRNGNPFGVNSVNGQVKFS